MIWVRTLAVVVAISAVLLPLSAGATCIAAPELAPYRTAQPEDFALGPTRSDRLGRVVAPVHINGQGPFRFVVDTGANRSVVSEELAASLGLGVQGTGEVHSVHQVSLAPLAMAASLNYGDLQLGSVSMPILQGAMLAGQQGLLGVDGMRGRRLLLDFENYCIEIRPSRGAPRLRGWVRVRGELHFGNLVLIRGSVNGVETNLLLDTGSDTSLANNALREQLGVQLERSARQTAIRSLTAGAPVMLEDSIFLPRVSIGPLDASNIRAYVGAFHIFELWGLADEPTLLVGMDVISQVRGLAIDYGRSDVYFQIRGTAATLARRSRASNGRVQ